jgi:hypothetical protein
MWSSKEDHATGLILAEPELVDLAIEIEPQSVGDFVRQDPLPLLVRERLGKQTEAKPSSLFSLFKSIARLHEKEEPEPLGKWPRSVDVATLAQCHWEAVARLLPAGFSFCLIILAFQAL